MSANQSISSLESVLDLAVWLEKHGQAFYEDARDAVTDPGLKETFATLAAEEKKHCAIYTDLYELYTGKSAEGDELLGEYGNFIRLLIKEISQFLEFDGVLTQEELIDRALQFEKDTLLYFNEVKPLFRGKAGALIEAVCREEKRHIQQLLERRELMRGVAEQSL
ncbi:MAG: ferritin family protein [Deltaproteobacteria bacterium]|nr:ferritin family protein [Deltaproteobacteria bacterium]